MATAPSTHISTLFVLLLAISNSNLRRYWFRVSSLYCPGINPSDIVNGLKTFAAEMQAKRLIINTYFLNLR